MIMHVKNAYPEEFHSLRWKPGPIQFDNLTTNKLMVVHSKQIICQALYAHYRDEWMDG